MHRASAILSQVALLLLTGCGGQVGNAELEMPDDPTDAPPSAPPSWESSSQIFDPPDVSMSGESFGMDIVRTYSGKREALLLGKAEKAQPIQEDVLTLMGPPGKQAEMGASPGESLWWYLTFDGIRIPYAVTSDALLYYTAVIKAFESGDFSPALGITMQKAYLKYSAQVEHRSQYQLGSTQLLDVDIVKMTLSWSQYCGPECAMAFFKERTVVFDSEGNIVAVLGDGATQYVVS